MSVVKQCRLFAGCISRIYAIPLQSFCLHFQPASPSRELLLNTGNKTYGSKIPGTVKWIHTTSSLKSSIQSQESESVLHITEACAKQLKKIATDGQFLRLTVEGGGCSGFSYKFNLDKVVNNDDMCFEKDGIKVVSDELSMELIKGSTVDYEVELIKSAFIIKDNPQSSTKCSCGVSFSID